MEDASTLISQLQSLPVSYRTKTQKHLMRTRSVAPFLCDKLNSENSWFFKKQRNLNVSIWIQQNKKNIQAPCIGIRINVLSLLIIEYIP